MVKRFSLNRTSFDLPLVIFVLSAAVGIWAAYNRQAAWVKFWLLIGAVLLFYAMAGQPRAKLWKIAGLMSGAGFLLAAYFLLTYNWQESPLPIRSINQLALAWMRYRPYLPLPAPDTDLTGGVLAILIPFAASYTGEYWQGPKKEKRAFLLASLALIVMLVGLLLSGERVPGFTIVLLAGIGLWWKTSAFLMQLSHRTESRVQIAVFLFGLAVIAITALILLLRAPGGILTVAESLPGPERVKSRAILDDNSLHLAGDFLYTGGGLNSFSGLYSQYILVIPYSFIDNSHNLFLEVLVEQGIFGFLALLVIWAGSIWFLIKETFLSQVKDGLSSLRIAVLASIFVAVVYASTEEILYGGWDTLLLFLLPGVAVALTAKAIKEPPTLKRWKLQGGAAISALALVGLAAFYRPILAEGYADLGAVKMARIELTNFPTGNWEFEGSLKTLTPARDLFLKALQYDPTNRTANYRLGMMAMLYRDYATAVSYLSRANAADRHHRGIQKALGYSLVWLGKYDQANQMLAEISEAKDEMDVYTWWWRDQGRPELGKNAAEMARLLNKLDFTKN